MAREAREARARQERQERQNKRILLCKVLPALVVGDQVSDARVKGILHVSRVVGFAELQH
jgi:hypothetical protein